MIEVTRKYQVILLDHPKEGAQQYLGQGPALGYLIGTAIRQAGSYGILTDTTYSFDLYEDTGTSFQGMGDGLYWDDKDYSGPRIRKLYGPIKVRVIHLGMEMNVS